MSALSGVRIVYINVNTILLVNNKTTCILKPECDSVDKYVQRPMRFVGINPISHCM